MSEVLGFDIGGTGIKAALVDVKKGILASERIKYATPSKATPESVAPILKQILADFSYKGNKVGVGFPTLIKNNVCLTTNNIDSAWLGTNLKNYFEEITGVKCRVLNDADAAGYAEFKFGKIKDVEGTAILLTLGTGVGSALFRDGKMLPNTELGSLRFKGDMAEKYVSNKTRKTEELDWETWGLRLNEYLHHVNLILSPDLIVLGGGISKKFKTFAPYISDEINVCPAEKFNNAGIIGAAASV